MKKPIEYLDEKEVSVLEIYNKNTGCTPDGNCKNCGYPSLCFFSMDLEVKRTIKETKDGS